MDNPRIAKYLIAYYAAPCLVFVFLVIFFSIPSNATTVVVITSDSGISMATDSKHVAKDVGLRIVGERDFPKAVIVKNRITIACIYRCDYRFTPKIGEEIKYGFATWVLNIERGLQDTVSFDDFVGVVNDEISKMMPKLQPPLRGGAMEPERSSEIFEMFAQYVIAGYQNGIPRLTVLEFYIDWESKSLLGPYQRVIEPPSQVRGTNHAHSYGISEPHADFTNRQSYAYKQAMAHCPKALQDFIDSRSITLDETAALARTLVGIDEQTNPNEVGGMIRCIQILPNGRAQSVVADLPKTNPTRKH
jgi:hypothetical protein